MINKQDLRLGNWVNCHFQTRNFNAQVLEIRHGGVLVQDGEHKNCYSYENISSIELTEDILLKAGFKKNGHVGWNNLGGMFTIDEWWSVAKDTEKWNFGFDEIDEGLVVLSYLNYLHQLQGLIFYHTGKELEIKQIP